jgi:hypothetical protein
MAQLAKFDEKAIALFGCQQIAENVPVENTAPVGTITTTSGSAAVPGVGTAFLSQVALNSYLFDATGLKIIGQVIAIASDTALTLDAVVPAVAVAQASGVMAISAPVTGTAFQTGLGPKNAIAVLNLNFSVETTTDVMQYVGDELDRDETTDITDLFAKFDFEARMPTRGTMAGSSPVESEIPLADWYQSCGMALILGVGYYSITNSIASNAYLTVDVRRSSPDLAVGVTQKAYVLHNVRGGMDLDMVVGSKPKLKFNMLGNLSTIAQKLTLVPNFRNMKFDVSPAIKSSTTILTEMDAYTSGAVPAITGVSNFCFQKINMVNMSGWSYTRYLLTCGDGWSKRADPTDVTVSILEDSAAAALEPYSKLGTDYLLTIDYADKIVAPTVGKQIEVSMNKVKLAKVTQSKIATNTALDLNMRNISTTTIKFY